VVAGVSLRCEVVPKVSPAMYLLRLVAAAPVLGYESLFFLASCYNLAYLLRNYELF
jgi:hypothetical protein